MHVKYMTKKELFKRTAHAALALIMAFSLISCTKAPSDPRDPYENFNRAMYRFNDVLDITIMQPVAKTYNFVTPYVAQRGISNFFSNIGEITTLPNDLLQGKFKFAGIDITRFLINSTLGIGGLFDVASRAGLPKHREDFGMTLAYYSKDKQSPYLVLPFFGPSTFRDAFAKPFDAAASPWPYLKPHWLSYALVTLSFIDLRARLLPADKLISDSFDPYVFVRNAYLQKRNENIANNEHDYEVHSSQNSKHSADATSEHRARRRYSIHPDEKPLIVTRHSSGTGDDEQPIIVTGRS